MAEDIDLRRYPVLVVDDEEENLSVFRFNFRRVFDLVTASSAAEAVDVLERQEVGVIITDLRMPGDNGLELLSQARTIQPDAVGIILTAYTDVEELIEAINLQKVYRYITKPWSAPEVKGVVRQALERYHLARENARLSDQIKSYAGYLDFEAHSAFDFGAIVGASTGLRELMGKVEQVAPTRTTVLITGETGTGKEMVARAVHLNSDRADRPFIAINCAALPAGLLGSELFGHEKGAFTNALSRRRGRFELADGGTIFLDEVGDLPLDMQVKLLRVLQERELTRVGGTETISVDVRVVSATNADLEDAVAEERFRSDLYYRLAVFPLPLPALRERGDDVLLLADHFLRRYAEDNGRGAITLADDARAALVAYRWPGNVRELQNVIERAVILSAADAVLSAEDLDFGPRTLAASERKKATTAPAPNPDLPLRERLEDEERTAIVQAIQDSGGNIAAAARSLGINRSTLYFRIKKFGLGHLLPNQLGPASGGPSD